MNLHFTQVIKLLSVIILLCCFKNATCQVLTVHGAVLENLEAAITKKVQLQEIQAELILRKQQAISSHDDILLARTLNDLLKIKDLRTEDTLYFRNSAFMDTLINSPGSSAQLKALLRVLRAQRSHNFNYRYLKFNRGAYATNKAKPGYAALSAGMLDSAWNKDLDTALLSNAFKGDASRLLWLSSNPGVFLFKPQFEDIVLSERVNLSAIRSDHNYDQLAEYGVWLRLPSKPFIIQLDLLAAGSGNRLLGSYGQWLAFNKNNPEISGFIESLARKYIYLQTAADTTLREVYGKYLLEETGSPYPIVKAHAIYQLCLLWNEEGNKYANPVGGYRYLPPTFDSKYQYYPAKALELYEQHKKFLSVYPVFEEVLALMARQIRFPSVSADIRQQHLPGMPIPLKVMYRNTDTLSYRIVRDNFSGNLITQGKFKLPLPPDYNRHSVYLKLDSLPTGHYRLVFGNPVISLPFEVTRITAVNTDENIFILDRQTGFPLAGAQIKAFQKAVEVTTAVAAVADSKGRIKIDGEIADSINIVYKGDTSGYRFSARKNELREEVYDEDSYDGLGDYYDYKLQMQIFTDRSIYRPGQTVHYKLIFLTSDPLTGKPILFNRDNVGAAIFKERLKKWHDEGNDQLKLKDPFRKKIDSARFEINEFGSFAGSFNLPKTAATGDWRFDGMPDLGNENDGGFKVEEYKRPTIELTMEKQQKMLLPGDPFAIKLKLRSLSGAVLGSTPVNYTISRRGRMPSKTSKPNDYYGNYSDIQIVSKTAQTDEKGEVSLPVNDTTLAGMKLADSEVWSFTYQLNATAVDATGETSAVDESVNVSSRPIRINIPIDNTCDKAANKVLNVSTTADNEGTVGRKVHVLLYRLKRFAADGTSLKYVDQWYYKQADWNKWFPELAITPAEQEEKILVLDTMINTAAFEKLKLDWRKMQTGYYRLVAQCDENGKITGQSTYNFTVFDSKTGDAPDGDIDYLPVNTGKAGDRLSWYSSDTVDSYTIYQALYVSSKKKKAIIDSYYTVAEKSGLRKWLFRIPADAEGQVLLNRITVKNNKIIKHEKTIYIEQLHTSSPEVIIEKYRKVMAPGAKETFTLSVKTKNDNVAAEILTTLYDASLDKLEKHNWRLPREYNSYNNLYTNWNYSLTTTVSSGTDEGPQELPDAPGFQSGVQAGNFSLLQGRAAGVSISSAGGLNEVVVVGYGSVRKSGVSGSTSIVTLRGASGFGDYKQPLVVVDGAIYTGDLKNMNASMITQIMVLKGADASAIFGSTAAAGVLVISTKGPIVLPGSEEPVAKIRKNFNETAFFFPQVHAGTDGYYSFSFTMPETATEWNWKILAHTRKAQFVYTERTLQTQLNLMVQPNMPRLLYQGDQIKLQSRVSNLDTASVQGTATCKIEDAVTGEDLTAAIAANNSRPFKLDGKSSGAVSFDLHVPAGQTNPLKIVIAAAGGGVADAEEHILPILSSKIFVRQSQPVQFGDKPQITLTSIALPKDASLYGVGLSIVQKPQASLINALPWLANYSFDCAEQTFNKLRAQVTALKLMQKDTAAQNTFKQATAYIEKDKAAATELPDELADETMPWLGVNTHAAQQQRQLFHLLDTPDAKTSIDKHLERLYKLQQPDGGLAWFDGGYSNTYISAYVLAGFGQLRQMGWSVEREKVTQQQEFINRLVKYQEGLLNAKNATFGLYQLYSMSGWLQEHPASAQYRQSVDSAFRHINQNSLGQQALLIIVAYRYGDTRFISKAQQLLENIQQLAIQDDTNGMRWKDIADSEDLDSSAEETMALLAEAFEAAGKNKDVNPGILKWLMTAKQDEHWQTTKATAAAINLLQKEKHSALGDAKSITAQTGNQLTVSDGLLDGIPAAFMKTSQQPASIILQQQGNNARGNLTWYYFASSDGLDTLNKSVKIEKQFYTNDKDIGWVPLNTNSQLKPGDVVKVKLTINTANRLKFVHINDPRAAAFEPKEGQSGYRYDGGISYYRSVRDTGTEIFTEAIPKGISETTYELVVAHQGHFTSGPATLQCMYQPAVTAYSNSGQIVTE